MAGASRAADRSHGWLLRFRPPVANAALGRDWAANGGFAWQVAYNYSTIPLRVDIVFRQPFAFRARLEVISPHGYARENRRCVM